MRATSLLRALMGGAALIAVLNAVSLVQDLGALGLGWPPSAVAAEPAPFSRPPAAPAATPTPAAAPATSPAPAATPLAETGEAPDAIAAALRARREALAERERLLAVREAVLVATERRLTARVEELTTLQQRLERAETEAREREETHWRGLARLYETMRPREAASVFNELDMPVLAQLVDRMNDRKAAAILGVMQPERVRLLTVELARLRGGRSPA
jgi:flagellar motility protein MotE (MotC chaperone)